MVKSALSTLGEVDAVMFMINADERRSAGDNFIIDRLKNVKKPIYLVINKIDQVHPDHLLESWISIRMRYLGKTFIQFPH